MGTFVNNDVSSGAVVYASDHNTQGSLIAAVLNGGIDNTNIASGAAIATSKLADDAGVTTAKLASGSVTNAKLSTTSGEIGGAWTSYTPTCVGWSGTPTTTDTAYMKIGKTIFYRFIVTGTSNTTGVSIGLPVAAKAGTYSTEGTLGLAQNAGTFSTSACRMVIDPSTSVNNAICYTNMSSAGWTASGTKTVRGLIVYESA